MWFYRDEKRSGVPDSIKKGAWVACLKRYRGAALLWLVSLGAVFAVYGLYGLPWEAAVYAAVLCGVLALAVFLRALIRCYRRLLWLRLLAMKAGGPGFTPPEAGDAWEAAYLEMLEALEARCRSAEEKARQEAGKASKYYTLWSHQVKTPLAAMRLLLQEDPPDRQALAQELFKTEQYIEMALQYQRLDGGRDLELRELPLEPMVRQAVKRAAILFIHKKVAVRLEPLEASVLTDEKWLVFVLEQLLTNAVKYTPAGGTVTLSLLPPATLMVGDTGIGIRPEDLPRVTEWGYTGYNGRLDKRATGVGLNLCKQAMDMLGHGMRIESRMGEGTRVFLDLARKRLDVE